MQDINDSPYCLWYCVYTSLTRPDDLLDDGHHHGHDGDHDGGGGDCVDACMVMMMVGWVMFQII